MNLLLIYFILGLILGGTAGALYIVGLIKYHKVQADSLREFFPQLLILLGIIIFIILLASTVLR